MKMHEKKLKKFKVYKVIANIFFYLVLIAGAIGIIALTVALILLMTNNIGIAEIVSSLGQLMDISESIPNVDIPYSVVTVAIFALAAVVALASYLFRNTSKLFGNIVETQTPFHSGTIKRLKNMGIAMFIYTGVAAILSSISGAILTGLFMDQSINTVIDFDLATVFYGLLLFALAEIFEFGASLQKDSESIV